MNKTIQMVNPNDTSISALLSTYNDKELAIMSSPINAKPKRNRVETYFNQHKKY